MSKKKSLRGTEKFMYLINILVALSLMISYLLPYLSPLTAPKISMFSLLFPAVFVLNILFFIYWLIKGKKQLFLSLIFGVIGFSYFTSLYKVKGKEILQNGDLKIMSFNVKMLNHYGWSKDDSLALKAIDFIHQKKPDVVLLQEFYDNKSLAFQYPYRFIKMKSKTDKFGLAIFSKFPMVNSGSLDFKESANNSIFCDIRYKNDTIRFYNIHLESLKVNPVKENFGEETSEKLISRMASTFKKQAEQVAVFLKHEEQWTGKKIVVGDFNNTAFSWAYHQIKGDKIDAFEEAGKGFGKTFDYIFPLRIDFILTDDSFEVNHYKTHPVKLSDHYPISARLLSE